MGRTIGDQHRTEAALLEASGEGIAAALEHNTKLATLACELEHKPHAFSVSGIKKRQFVAFRGAITEYDVENDPPKHEHRACDLDAFVELVKGRWIGIDGDGNPLGEEPPTVWHAGDVLVAHLDPKWRQQTISYVLAATAARGAIERLGNDVHDQQALISLLKNDLAGSGLDAALLLSLRAVNFVKHEDAAGAVNERSHSFGTQIERRVIGIPDDFPEQLVARFAWWNVGAQVLSTGAPRAIESDASEQPNSALLDTIVSVRVAVEIDFAKKGFWLRPLKDDLERARQYAQRVLHNWLVAEFATGDAEDPMIPVYHGSP